ncbi:cell division protein FtsL [Leucothrix pacifica]|uniref:Cell division protein FtsL n=1 Tax=Leucothrix pacifica TaxID=1247513 RepID=A0A317CCD6_9GAMM|nr:cell division protein FtsL [Leucothrix pacifica]PWQ95781.1 cell division protein FtsL [Leucothrix pacifica]
MKHWKLILLVSLYVGVVFAAIQVVTQRNYTRTLFVEAQKVQQERDLLTAEWSQLKIQQGTDLNEVRVEAQARRELGMHIPRAVDIRVIRE